MKSRTKKPMRISLGRNEHILCVVPEYCAGPGWSNTPLWIHIHNTQTNTLRTECLQPEDFSPEIHALFPVAAAANVAIYKQIPVSKGGGE